MNIYLACMQAPKWWVCGPDGSRRSVDTAMRRTSPCVRRSSIVPGAALPLDRRLGCPSSAAATPGRRCVAPAAAAPATACCRKGVVCSSTQGEGEHNNQRDKKQDVSAQDICVKNRTIAFLSTKIQFSRIERVYVCVRWSSGHHCEHPEQHTMCTVHKQEICMSGARGDVVGLRCQITCLTLGKRDVCIFWCDCSLLDT